ncbi:MAG: archease [Desulfobacteraceae bacterium]|nr:archease [Desulfobacteraceae bacterium]MBC2756062.1 archease [Desulfobacteraceae bacterium]
MAYTLIDHTADIGICVTETSIKDLFETAAHAMFEQITEPSKLSGTHTRDIHIKGIDRPDLLINWLRELLWCWTIDNCLIKQVVINKIDNSHLSAKLSYDKFDPQTHEILKDIKAVTYHGASVEETEDGWEATIIFDV